jgi:hypothetical protein
MASFSGKVTRLGDFTLCGQLQSLANFCKITLVAKMYSSLSTENGTHGIHGLGYTLGYLFSQSHLVTLLTGCATG